MPIWAAAIGAGTSLFAGSQAKKSEAQARKLAEGEKQNALGFLDQAGSMDALFQALQEAQLKSGQKKELGAFAGAKKATELGATNARQTILNRGAQDQAKLTQGLIGRGLIGTSAGTGAAMDLGGQVNQQLADIDQQLAAAMANLGLAEGQTEMRQAGDLASLIGRGQDFQRQLGVLRTDFAPSKVKKTPGATSAPAPQVPRFSGGFGYKPVFN